MEARPDTDTVASTSPPSDVTDTLRTSPIGPEFKPFGVEPSSEAASAIASLTQSAQGLHIQDQMNLGQKIHKTHSQT